MSHIRKGEWEEYVKDTIDDHLREQYETHMYACEACLQIYLDTVEAHENKLPLLQNEEAFTTMVMSQVTKKQPKIVRFDKKIVIHYVLAAAATLVLMLSGVFQSITSYVDVVQSPVTPEEKAPSLTESMMERTFSLMDTAQRKWKEEEKQ